jgi:hypothetical protein
MRRLGCAACFLFLAAPAWGANTISLRVAPSAPTDASPDVTLTISGNSDADSEYADLILVPGGTQCPRTPSMPTASSST